ncbi:MAG: GNAT family N-acetyltransferase [Candidatus Absconditabacterales bacterium]|nr:GNAT family N-acetyltransferase [Candidatus Absconditabacterales bacterium]
MQTLRDFVYSLATGPHLTAEAFFAQKRHYAKQSGLSSMPSNAMLFKEYADLIHSATIQPNYNLQSLLKKRSIRSQSGIVSVQILTKPFWCPGKCIFCPNDPTMPKSYIKTEPGAMRAYLNAFCPVRQIFARLKSLKLTGHAIDKVEMIILGGTWDVYPEKYKHEVIYRCYQACNLFPTFWDRWMVQNDWHVPTAGDFARKHQSVLDKKPEQEKIFDDFFVSLGGLPAWSVADLETNQTAAVRIIGLTIETRPEYVTDANCRQRREWGVTRIETGIQSTDNTVLAANKRDNTCDDYRRAMHRLRQYGFKISAHIMPGLYQSSYESDRQSFVDLYTDPWLKPDEIKLYPTSVIPDTELYTLYREGKYTPIDTDYIARLTQDVFWSVIPCYTRVKRFIRDIPATEIAAGSSVTNLAQLLYHQWSLRLAQDIDARRALYNRLDHDVGCLSTVISRGAPLDFTAQQSSFVRDTESVRHFSALDTRSREIRHRPDPSSSLFLVTRIYDVSNGTEYFLSVEDELGYLYALCRLSLPRPEYCCDIPGLGQKTALIRELHVYGTMKGLKKNQQLSSDKHDVQHQGLGSGLLSYAKQYASHHGYQSLSVISGVGVREYYRRQGFSLVGTYMVCSLSVASDNMS